MADWVVLKFGGTSVSTRERWETIRDQVAARCSAGEAPFVVCSALSGISNLLERLLVEALHDRHEDVLDEIEARHRDLAAALGVAPEDTYAPHMADLRRMAVGISLVSEVSPRLHARVLAQGELMSTRLGAAFLTAQGYNVAWRDAREMLIAVSEETHSASRRYLSAACSYEADPKLVADLATTDAVAVITQGFIACDDDGDTVLLGRGGSDTSAAYFAARLQAVRCEIWTDVPGMYTANPREIPTARLLKQLDYDEAQEIATTGAKVLHPRCIAPVRAHRIPLHIRCTEAPDLDGTTVSAEGAGPGARLKAISAKTGITLVSMDTVGMWQQVGFLADVFNCFKNNGLSVDLVSTSEMNVTVSLDPAANALTAAALRQLEQQLGRYCRVRIIQSCAAVSLVGRKIRAILHKLGGAMELFEEHRIHLVSQAASDLNLTFVVDEEQAQRLVRQLHNELLGSQKDTNLFGPTWQKTFSSEPALPKARRVRPWWWQRRGDLIDATRTATPTYVYDEETLRERASELLALPAFDRVYYAMKANGNREILRLFHGMGLGFECVSLGEIERVRELFGDDADVLFTPNFAPRKEYEAAFADGARVTLDNVQPLRSWPEVFEGRELMLRIDPGHGRGHHDYVKTAGAQSKFGISPSELDQVAELVQSNNVRVVGLHAHTGSGITTPEAWREVAVFLAQLAERFEHVEIIDVGGGLGVPQKPSESRIDLQAVNDAVAEVNTAHPDLKFWLEPGRYLVAEAGVLVATVTQTKIKGDVTYVGIDTGMNSLIRPALYGAWHQIVNLSRLGEPRTVTANIVGPICETGDTLGYGRNLPETREGDLLLIANAGAYGRAMSSEYNLRKPADELVLAASSDERTS